MIDPKAGGLDRSISIRARWDDCDRFGHLNNAAYVALAREAHDALAVPGARLVEFEISHRAPVMHGGSVEVRITARSGNDGLIATDLEFTDSGRSAATAHALWTDLSDLPPRPLSCPEPDAGGRWFDFEEPVRTYHLGPDGRLRPQVALQSFEHAVFRAAAMAGWPLRRMDEAGFVSLVVSHHLVLGFEAEQGEALHVVSRLVEVRRVSGTWLHEMRRGDGTLVAADLARGAFLDRAGRIRPAPIGLIDDLLLGEPRPSDD